MLWSPESLQRAIVLTKWQDLLCLEDKMFGKGTDENWILTRNILELSIVVNQRVVESISSTCARGFNNWHCGIDKC